jgi:hypothetical protein
MKYLPILLLMLALLVSGCTGLPADLIGQLPIGQNIVSQGDPYLQLSVQTIPKEIVPGRTLTLVFEVTNNNNFDLNNVIVKAYDKCIFDDNGQNEETFDLRSNQSKTWTWEWTTQDTTLEKDCVIKISANKTAT